ncbi:MAG: cytochrome c family protein, partial [Brevundimonas sp.]
MSRIALAVPLAAIGLLSLSACGDGASGPAAPAAPPRPALSPEQKAVLLAALPAPYNQGDLENGRRVFARCRSCHTVTEGGPNMTGPNLYGV